MQSLRSVRRGALTALALVALACGGQAVTATSGTVSVTFTAVAAPGP